MMPSGQVLGSVVTRVDKVVDVEVAVTAAGAHSSPGGMCSVAITHSP